jgi:hypothetical protein
MRFPSDGKTAWFLGVAGLVFATAILWTRLQGTSPPVQQPTEVAPGRRAELAQAADVVGAAAMAHPDRRAPATSHADAGAPEPPSTAVPQAAPPAGRARHGEITWSVQSTGSQDGGAEKNGSLCGGKVCRATEFCCGPAECGHCANRQSGPRCPDRCP